MQNRGLVSAQQGRLDALRAKHAALDIQIREEQRHPSASELAIRAMKAQKLKIKEEIELQEGHA